MASTSLVDEHRQLLADHFGGDLTGPEDSRYDELRRCHNGMIDKKPALLASCRGTAEATSLVGRGGGAPGSVIHKTTVAPPTKTTSSTSSPRVECPSSRRSTLTLRRGT